ncbi:MAG: hypothetical protein JWN87_796 [Frankiales bacterium]|nr:hypothetical protein [Frankiales bacterium]
MQSSNPVFGNAPTLKQGQSFGAPGFPTAGQVEEIYRTPQRLTMDDIVIKTGLLLSIVVAVGAVVWFAKAPTGVVIGGGLLGFVLALVNIFKRQVSPALVIAYAVCQGAFLGGISFFFENTPGYAGLPLQAAVGTAAIFGAVLFLYKSGKLRATPQFVKVVTGAFIGLFALLILNVLINAFDGSGSGLGLRDGSNLAILFSIAFIAVGSLTFVLDFDQADKMVQAGVDQREAWRVSFGLVVGLVWLYLEILRLLSYLRDR